MTEHERLLEEFEDARFALLMEGVARKEGERLEALNEMLQENPEAAVPESLDKRCLEVIDRYGFGVSILTKSDLVLRDLDLLWSINAQAKAVVCTTLTTFDEDLCRILEPNVCTTRRRFEMLRTCHEAGIRTGVWLCPLLPFLNDSEENLRGLLDYCFRAGVEVIVQFGMGVTLRDGDRQYFYAQLDRHFPGMKERYIRAFGSSYCCLSPNAPRLEQILQEECRARGVLWEPEAAMAWLMEFEDPLAGEQLHL